VTRRQIGHWAIVRSIFDLDCGSEISCIGFADLRPDDTALVYDETVSFRLAGKLIRASRAYRFGEHDGAIVAMFSDGSPFFTLRLNDAGVGSATHQCGDDLYALTLTVREPESWQTQWDVSGTKSLRIVTRYTSTIAPYVSGRRSR
jgi:hypothetical protein